MNQQISRKQQIAKWWKVEGKIECSLALIVLGTLLFFWDQPIVEGSVLLFCSAWCLGKIYFRKERWALFVITTVLLFLQAAKSLSTN